MHNQVVFLPPMKWGNCMRIPSSIVFLTLRILIFSSVQFSSSVMSDSLRPHGLQHARPPCPSPAPRVYSNACPLSQWCYATISSSVVPFSSCLQSFPASGSFQMSHFFTSGGQSIGTQEGGFINVVAFPFDLTPFSLSFLFFYFKLSLSPTYQSPKIPLYMEKYKVHFMTVWWTKFWSKKHCLLIFTLCLENHSAYYYCLYL